MKRNNTLTFLLLSVVLPLKAVAFDTVEGRFHALVLKPGNTVAGSQLSFFPPALEPWLLDISGTLQIKARYFFISSDCRTLDNTAAREPHDGLCPSSYTVVRNVGGPLAVGATFDSGVVSSRLKFRCVRTSPSS